MAIERRSVVLGVFRDRSLAEQAVAELNRTSWGNEGTHILGKSSGGFLNSLRNAFSERQEATTGPVDDLNEFDMPQDQRQTYDHELEAGSSIVVARIQGHELETRDILHRYGAFNVFVPLQQGGKQTIEVRQEVPYVQKYTVDVGEIRIHKRVITEQQTFTVPVTREEVTIERLPRNGEVTPTSQLSGAVNTQAGNALSGQPTPNYDRATGEPLNSAGFNPATGQSVGTPGYDPMMNSPLAVNNQTANAVDPNLTSDDVLHGDGSLRILVHEERVQILKQTVVAEEIRVRKETVQETKRVVEPVRHEEVRLERVGKVPLRGDLPYSE